MSEDNLISRLHKGDTLVFVTGGIEDIERSQFLGSKGEGELTSDEIDLIDTYFSRNYHQGELLQIPDDCYIDGKKWTEGKLTELGFLSTKKDPYGGV